MADCIYMAYVVQGMKAEASASFSVGESAPPMH